MKALIGEFIGTLFLVLLGDGVCCNISLNKSGMKGGNTVHILIGWGMAVMVPAFTFGALSGAHFNPAVTIGAALRGGFSWGMVPGYIVAQCLGGFCGAAILMVLYGDHIKATEDDDVIRGCFCTGPSIRNTGLNFLSEFVATFVLVFTLAGIPGEAVLNLPDINSVYDVPLNVLKSGVLKILNEFVDDEKEPDMSGWKEFSKRCDHHHPKTVTVGLVAKYVGNDDTYICVTEALKAAAAWNNVNLNLKWIKTEELGDNVTKTLKECDGLVVPGGFGVRGTEGKIKAAEYALNNDVPYLGLCLGMQVACIAAARKGGVKNANSEEFGAKEKDGNNVIYIMEDQKGKESTGGTMRLGDYIAILDNKSKTKKIYETYDWGKMDDERYEVIERHRHRYEVNQKFLPEMEKGGIKVSGTSPDGTLVEFIEAPNRKFFVATQAHPEFKSRPLNVHPLFMEFVKSLK